MLNLKKIEKFTKKFKKPKYNGLAAKEMCPLVKAEGLDTVECIGVLRNIYPLSLIEAKELVMCEGTEFQSLSEYQEKNILPALEEFLKSEQKNN